MTEPPRIGVLHRPGAAATLPDLYRSAAGWCAPVVLLSRQFTDPPTATSTLAEQLFPTVPYRPDELVEIVRAAGIQGLVTFHDDELELLDRTLAELGLPGNGSVPEPWDKLVQRQLTPPAWTIPAQPVNSAADLPAAARLVGFPAVLKPRRGTGGDGISFLADQGQLAAQLSVERDWSGRLLEARLPAGRPPQGLSQLGGFVSVETVNLGDERWHAAVTDKVPVSVQVERSSGTALVGTCGDILPTRLSEPELGTVLTAVSESLDALDVRDRVTHTEVWLTDAGPKIIEINGRVGGHLARLLCTLGGPDLVRIALQLSVGIRPACSSYQLDGCGMTYYPNFARGDGVVSSEVSLVQVRRLPGVTAVSELAKAGRPRQDNARRMVNLTIREPDFGTLDRSAASVAEQLSDLFAADR